MSENYLKLLKFIDCCSVGLRLQPPPLNTLRSQALFLLASNSMFCFCPPSCLLLSLQPTRLFVCVFCVSVSLLWGRVGATLLPSDRANQQLLPEREGIHLSESREAVHGGGSARQQLERTSPDGERRAKKEMQPQVARKSIATFISKQRLFCIDVKLFKMNSFCFK